MTNGRLADIIEDGPLVPLIRGPAQQACGKERNMKKRIVALRGDLIYNRTPDELAVLPDHWVTAEDGVVVSAAPAPPAGAELLDFRGKVIIPGMVDLHLHAPQYTFRGLGMDKELLDWLAAEAFPEEARYADRDYARRAYGIFAGALRRSPTTRACIFATVHTDAALALAGMLEETGLRAFLGKVNMDRDCPDGLRETAEGSLAETRRFLEGMEGFTRIKPILTPRFVPSCSDRLMAGLGELQRETGLPVQSHLSENEGEIALVASLCPDTEFYAQAYDKWGLFGGTSPAVMAHCVHSGPAERALMKKNGVFAAHCPQSNTNLASGIAPVRRMLEEGLQVGLGTDVAGGASLSLFRAVTDAIQASKLYWRLVDQSCVPLTVPEALWLATRGGGAFFGKVGAFEPGYELDALVLDDSGLPAPRPFSPVERLERLLWLGGNGVLAAKFAAGERVL